MFCECAVVNRQTPIRAIKMLCWIDLLKAGLSQETGGQKK